jgi:hypothetical protein
MNFDEMRNDSIDVTEDIEDIEIDFEKLMIEGNKIKSIKYIYSDGNVTLTRMLGQDTGVIPETVDNYPNRKLFNIVRNMGGYPQENDYAYVDITRIIPDISQVMELPDYQSHEITYFEDEE